MLKKILKNKRQKKNISNGDFWLVVSVMALVVFGVSMVFSASYYNALANPNVNNSYIYLVKSLQWVIAGLIAMMITAKIDYHIYFKGAVIITVISLILLILVLTDLSHTSHNASRWIKLGSITIMPGEMAKPAAICFTAYFFSKNVHRANDFRCMGPFLLAIVYAALIMLQPNLSTALTVVIIISAMMFVAGIKWRYVGLIMSFAVLSVTAVLKFMPKGHWLDRIEAFKDPFAYMDGIGWQIVHSFYALAGGGLLGRGLGHSVEKKLWLPEPQNDFILSIIGEEVGFIGCLIMVAVYFVIFFRSMNIAVYARDIFGSLLASGIAVMIVIQLGLNIAVVTSSMPATGISLPFISYGGNSLLIFMASVGVLLNIKKQSNVKSV